MNQRDLESYLWGAATYLRGTIDAGDYKQYIFPLLFFKRICDVYDEEYQNALNDSDGDTDYALFAENHRFLIPNECHWDDVREVTVNVGSKIQKSLREIEKENPDSLNGIFGDANWTNKDRLSDEILTNLIEHYSKHNLNTKNVPSDQLGDAYEYLIKQFANDSGHTAAEFYTNRTVVRLMTLIMDPKPGESVYDPTCGSGGLLLNCALQLKKEGKEYRSLRLYGQEINIITSSISRMNMFMHGIEEFDIFKGDTLANPGFKEKDELQKFNVVLANPPYSIKRWDQKSFETDPYGRNIWGTPPQGCADYAFQQHIIKSLDLNNGRSIVLWPYGVLFRDAEKEMRTKMIQKDLVEAVIALGKNLFYNSGMESCLLLCRNEKQSKTKNKIIFIDARKEVRKEKQMSYLDETHIQKILNTYLEFKTVDGFSYIADIDEVLENEFNLNVPLYVLPKSFSDGEDINAVFDDWVKSSDLLSNNMNHIFKEF
tara:strand:+ start:1807 stop:3261 length:1455 start_codon:yes stop_codon:yes gene_type:complete